MTGNIWNRRFGEINNFEKYLTDNGIIVLKFFLYVSKKEQKKRFLQRVDEPDKNWKFSAADIRERAFFEEYMDAYEDMFNQTSTVHAPWHIIPADHKWFTRLAVVSVINRALDRLHLAYPQVTTGEKEALERRRMRWRTRPKSPAPPRKKGKKSAGKKERAGKTPVTFPAGVR